jgi:hypothetical protein
MAFSLLVVFVGREGAMRWGYYLVALVATVAACFLWWVVYIEARGVVAAPRPVSSSGVLPVVPRLRPADPVRAALFDQLQRGQAVCLDGFYAVKGEDGKVYTVNTSEGRVSCP